MQGLDHENIRRYLDWFPVEQGSAIIWESSDARLDEYLQERSAGEWYVKNQLLLPPSEMVMLVRQMISVLHYLHQKQIVHGWIQVSLSIVFCRELDVGCSDVAL